MHSSVQPIYFVSNVEQMQVEGRRVISTPPPPPRPSTKERSCVNPWNLWMCCVTWQKTFCRCDLHYEF